MKTTRIAICVVNTTPAIRLNCFSSLTQPPWNISSTTILEHRINCNIPPVLFCKNRRSIWLLPTYLNSSSSHPKNTLAHANTLSAHSRWRPAAEVSNRTLLEAKRNIQSHFSRECRLVFLSRIPLRLIKDPSAMKQSLYNSCKASTKHPLSSFNMHMK